MNVKKVDENTYKIQSHTDKSTWYLIDVRNGSCSCPHYMFRLKGRTGTCKHYDDLMKHIKKKLDNNKVLYSKIQSFIKSKGNYVNWEDVVVAFSEKPIDDMVKFDLLIERRGKLMVM